MWVFNRSKGASGFSYSSTAEQVTQEIDGSGLTAIVTGASSGIGAEISRVLALHGVHVIMAVRNIAAGKDVKEAIVKEIPAAKVDIMELDLSSLASVRKFAADFMTLYHQVWLFVRCMFLCTVFVMRCLPEMSWKGNVRSFSFDKFVVGQDEGDNIYYSFWAYGQSKLANILHTCELTRRLKEEGVEITANSLHPGTITTIQPICFVIWAILMPFMLSLIVQQQQHSVVLHSGMREARVYTNFISRGFEVERLFSPTQDKNSPENGSLVSKFGRFIFKNVQQGASTTCYVALHPQLKGLSAFWKMSNVSGTEPRVFTKRKAFPSSEPDSGFGVTGPSRCRIPIPTSSCNQGNSKAQRQNH
ncbi:hypothetical protein KY290_018005 [Solanum tuberosum]|uniref:Short-chain dehydrogenase n=1 Tax=Solanum tuberosum TaxID=4113 RepID=A0ABQ7VF09_SOLTU|nr:hypothetical protein KY290_018005 [Solanum tuberosum]